MRMLIYLHGFRSSPMSVKAQRFVRAVAALSAATRPRLHVPELGMDPSHAMSALGAWIEREVGRAAAAAGALTLIGSSLGGYYATHLAERFGARAVLINPSLRPYDSLARWIGVQTNLYTGEPFEVRAEHFDQLRALKVERITHPQRYFLLVRSGDEVLPWQDAATFYAGAWQYVAGGGDHGWADFDDEIAPVLRFAERVDIG